MGIAGGYEAMKTRNFIFYLAGTLFLLSSGGTSAENRSGPSFVLSVQGSSLSFQGDGALLGEVLEELGRQADIEVHVADEVAEETVPFSFEDFPLDQGLKLILRGRNYILTYQKPLLFKGQPPAPKVAEIRVLPDGEEEIPAENRNRPSRQTPPPSSRDEQGKADDIEE